MPVGVYVRSEEHKRNLGNALKGKRRTLGQIQRMREAHKGIPNKNKGKHLPGGEKASNWRGGKPHCVDCGKEISYGHTRCHKDFIKYTWKGENVHIETLHAWIKHNKPKPQLCGYCHSKPPYDCANISGRYLRDVNDYEWLCRRCHMLKDGRIDVLRSMAGKTRELHREKMASGVKDEL